jgi:hypothetical protein
MLLQSDQFHDQAADGCNGANLRVLQQVETVAPNDATV